jgi:hypothetical protein
VRDDDDVELAHAKRTMFINSGQVGDINSTAIGSGARFSAGKAPLHLIPVDVLAQFATTIGAPDFEVCGEAECVTQLLVSLGAWQARELEAPYLLNYFDFEDIEEAAHVFDYGRKKYAEWNWAKGMAWSIPLGCIQRHAFAILKGEAIDPESGRRHLGHILCNVIMLVHFADHYNAGDDRPEIFHYA